MSILGYPGYKKSGIAWVGDIPSHWCRHRAKFLFEERNQKAEAEDEQLTASQKYGVIPQSLFSRLENQKVMQVITGREILKKAMPNDFVISMRSFQGGLEFCAYEGAVSSAYVPLVARETVCDQYFKFLFKSRPFVSALQRTSNLVRDGQALRYANFAQLDLAIPEFAEQMQIGKFLSHETAKIDALIREQERLIDLLQEKRQAVISHAVTKGLDPDVPMKDSGVEWLGEVPAHWDIVAIKWLSPVLRGASPRPIDDPIYFDDQGEYAWVRIADVSASNGVLTNTTQQLSGLGASLSVKLEPGAMFLSIAGTVGKPCITKIKACIHDGFVYFPRLEIPPKFLYRVFESGLCYGGLGKMGNQLILNTETVGGIKIGVMLIQEVEEIIVFVSDRLSRFDGLIEEAKLASSLLQERRSALISAAVTGKIDVRDWQPPADESAFDEEVRQAGMETTA